MLPRSCSPRWRASASSALLLASFGKLYRGEPLREFWSKNGWITPYYLALGLLGLALARLTWLWAWPGILAFVAPALMIRLAMKQYVDKTQENVQLLKEQNTELQTANVEIMRISDELRVATTARWKRW